MSLNFVIAPDFAPERFMGWHMLNTLLQKRTDIGMHIETPSSHEEQLVVIKEKNADLIYANPFDAATFIREQGYKAIAKPIGKSNEMVIVSSEKSSIHNLSDLDADTTIAMADNRDVKLIGLRLLEAEDLYEDDLTFNITENYQAAARSVIQGNSQIAFFMQEVFESLSKLTKAQLRVLIQSDISVLSHVVLIKHDLKEADALTNSIMSLHKDADGQKVLKELGLDSGFELMNEEDAEFMIDLMETLLD